MTIRRFSSLKPYEYGVLAAGLALFLALTCCQLDLPGPHYDEAIEVLPAMQILLGQPVETFRGAGLHLGRLSLPIMVMDYIGAMNTYLALPFFLALGINVIAMRLMPICFAAGTLLLTYFFARALFGRAAAAIALFTLAGSISFVFWSRQGIFVTNLTSTIMLGALCCALRWWRGGRRRYFYATALLLGLGLYTKLIFLWAIGAMAGAILLVNADRIIAGLRRRERAPWPARLSVNLRQALGAAAAFLAPLAPLLLFNLQTGGTWKVLTANLFSSYYGINNLAFFANLATRLDQITKVWEGSHFWYLGETFQNRLWTPALVGALAFVVFMAIWKRGTGDAAWRKALFPFAMIALMIVQSCFTVSALWFTHYAILTPLPPLALAGGLAFIARQSGRERALWPALAVLIMAIVGYDLLADIRYHTALAASGGYAAHSDASYKLAEALEQAGAGPAVALDWGIQAQVQFLTRGRVVPREIFGYDKLEEPDPAFGERLAPYLRDPRTIYVLHSYEQEVYRGRRFALEKEVGRAGKHSRLAQIIYERSGRPAYILVMVD